MSDMSGGNAGPALRMDDLMREAVARGASDIHLVAGQTPVMRVHGEIVPREDCPPLTADDTLRLAREVADGDRWEKFVREREMDFSVARAGIGRFRTNLYWQRDSVAIALRTISERIPSFSELGLPPTLGKFALMDHGLFLVTGPTGSGKSTTLAAMVNHINENKACNIVTIEDPVEYLHAHKKSLISQREMHQDTLSFHEALRRVLRQDPNVILVGELRDLETMQIAMTLAETGHLVLATLHTADATQALNRIIDSYPAHQQSMARAQLSFVLLGVLSQHLMRRRDASGRVLAFEFLVATPAIRNMVRTGEIHQVYSAIQTGSADGMATLNSSLFYLYKRGHISRDDALRKSAQPRELTNQIFGAER